MTVKEIAKSLLLKGAHINKGEFYRQYHTFTLTQRIEEIRKEGWDVQSKVIPGRNGMVEYWLEPNEIQRIISNKAQEIVSQYEAVEPQNDEDEQLLIQQTNIAPEAQNTAQTEEYEQMGIGLLGGRNYG